MNQRTKSKSSEGGGNKVFLLLGVLVVLAGGAWLYMAGQSSGGPAQPLPTPDEFEALSAQLPGDASVGILLGSESAPITIEEFIDYSCPACANFGGFTGRLIRQNYVETGQGVAKWITYDFVLGSFPNSVPAAMAARCAGDQGQYWPMHDMIFSRQTRWYTSNRPENEFSGIAEDLGLDMGAYHACTAESRYLQEIAVSRKYGEERGVGSTPTVFVDGQVVDLSRGDPYQVIESMIQNRMNSLSADNQ